PTHIQARSLHDALPIFHARNKPLDETVVLKAVSQRTPGFSGADLENLLNEASLVAVREGKKKIDMRDIEEATDRVIAGPAKKSRDRKSTRLNSSHVSIS